MSTTVTTKQTAKALNKAADYIEANGWCRGAFFDPRGQACLMGAVGVATGYMKPSKAPGERYKTNPDKRPLYSAAAAALLPFIGSHTGVTRELEEFDADTEAELGWRNFYDDADKADWLARRESMRSDIIADHVIDTNDGAKVGSNGKRRYLTTKTQALKLLRKAAAALASGTAT